MIQSLRLDHFRSHQYLELNDLGRVNLLLGKNNSGKTAVLEALLLAALPFQTPQVVYSLSEARSQNAQSVDDVWGGLFYAWDYRQPARISWTRDRKNFPALTRNGYQTGDTRFLEIDVDYEEQTNAFSVMGFADPANYLSRIIAAQMIVEVEGHENIVEYRVDRDDIESLSPFRVRPPLNANVPVQFLSARGARNTNVEAQRFGVLEVEQREGEVVEALKIIEPRLKRLTVVASPQSSAVYGDIGYGRLVPLGAMGDGMLRLLSIAQSLILCTQGILLIDEAENGLHFSVLENVWRLIFQTARRLNVQVFATTHSDECLAAATRAASLVDASDELRAFRLDQEAGRSHVAAFSGDNLGYALANGFEVRG